ncbi:flocculation protein FLO11-like [Lathyrus oleraceus]|uniref:flocculation protein FLO11-like n=1 Tax=Pisum sativum TaxID=3888 RepID=UPI0021D0A861|nr:flocculation protein FLO11-like [Pisum sativum]
MLNETTLPSSSPSPQSPPYYELSSDTESSDHQSPTLAQLQDRALASQKPSHPDPKPEVTSPPPEYPNPTTSEPQSFEPTHSEPQPSEPTQYEPKPSEPTHSEPQPSEPAHSDIPKPITSAEPTTPTLNLSAHISPSSPSQASSNKPETTLPTLEVVIKAIADVAAAGAEAKAKTDAEEAARIAKEVAAKAKADELTQGEPSHSGFVPLVLKTLEELQKEQQVVRARLDQQDSVNVNI